MVHVVAKAMSGDVMVRSGDVCCWLAAGSLVGVSLLMMQCVDWAIWWAMSVPLLSDIVECQRSSCALKSPSVMVVWFV